MTETTKDSEKEKIQSNPSDKTKVDNRQTLKTGIGKSDLAQELFPGMGPKSALNALRNMINSDADLQAQLQEASYNPNCHTLTYWQASIIRKHFYGPQEVNK